MELKEYKITVKMEPVSWHISSNVEFLDIPQFHILIKAKSKNEAREIARKIDFNYDISKIEKV